MVRIRSATLAAILGCALALLAALPAAAQLRLGPEKDKLFAFPGILETKDGGDFIVVDYDKMRDIHQRDEIPERKVKWQYVSTGVNWAQAHYDYTGGNGRKLRYVGVGAVNKPAKMIVVFLHGQNGTRFLGADDWSFGGNFNRIKNMVVNAGGVYLSPDFTDFNDNGAADVKALMLAYAKKSPGAPVFLACGSFGGNVCWKLMDDPQVSSILSGMLLLGSLDDPVFFGNPAMKPGGRRIPLYFGHGSDDKVFDWKAQAAFYDTIRKQAPGYPTQFVLFNTGSHGTPIRMTDWRQVINWMLQVDGY
ncbi:phospholipase [Kaistia algarum]|uniref:phospholipase n=1 Tax=Kaistia algarum TaxID=2083279 RepID=UPI000CE86FD2|nr:phospholipase [Kaistia algarum]MCX5515705.1 alpha/beta hydrolase [Kaistia algarum]PPE80915.1 phospholipase [Kaistia algarum]